LFSHIQNLPEFIFVFIFLATILFSRNRKARGAAAKITMSVQTVTTMVVVYFTTVFMLVHILYTGMFVAIEKADNYDSLVSYRLCD